MWGRNRTGKDGAAGASRCRAREVFEAGVPGVARERLTGYPPKGRGNNRSPRGFLHPPRARQFHWGGGGRRANFGVDGWNPRIEPASLARGSRGAENLNALPATPGASGVARARDEG